ncbi:DUF1905 domain-containing protein [Kibdelosporangium phytohabitans]|uniref:DUF1905 domain-containing protein n=1 Tax=Kibdelosporangium phytohabitans TaxID=860235 RepID=A0A0N7F5Q4_9PSEU|nr:DUF1905 domain-containing protein [Kibdelosporangium phytohabitans]ALG14879.1 hypothetical protein AOZ06_18630 [Kibdelosporangium phytohabitans]MBE1470233.1 hypothetical protein [Kibdelosporangium phytohabitans]
MIVTFEADLWLWDARKTDSWTFVSVPEAISEEIKEISAGISRGFGSVRVIVTVGATIWRTSIFPSAEGGYVLPVKRAVRKAEALGAGDTATVMIELVDF